jgi:hypothetical protein
MLNALRYVMSVSCDTDNYYIQKVEGQNALSGTATHCIASGLRTFLRSDNELGVTCFHRFM